MNLRELTIKERLELARSTSLSTNHQEKLEYDSNPEVRRALVLNPQTRPDILCRLASQYPKEFIQNPAFPLIALEEPNLFAKVFGALPILLRQPNVPTFFLEQAAQCNYPYLREMAAAHERLSESAMELLAQDPEQRVRIALARNPALHPRIINVLIFSDDPFTRSIVAHKQPGEVRYLLRRAGSSDDLVSCGVASEPMTQEELLALMERGPWGRFLAIKHPNTDGEMIEKALRFQDQSVMQEIGSWEDIPEHFLPLLAASKHQPTQMRLVQDPRTPPEVLLALSSGTQRFVREAILENENTPAEAIHRIIEQFPFLDMYRLAAQHPSTSAESLEYLASKSLEVKELAAQHPNIAPKQLEELAKDKRKKIRAAVAKNPKTPDRVLLKLLQDKDKTVVNAAQENPNAPIQQIPTSKKKNVRKKS